mmetsp:Transcript_16755/g.38748  ORF Transcript_16755/g.38748 Transcript_16755/m.38748 type:complete len:202 (+) Transcript_16755:1649-2254(+)
MIPRNAGVKLEIVSAFSPEPTSSFNSTCTASTTSSLVAARKTGPPTGQESKPKRASFTPNSALADSDAVARTDSNFSPNLAIYVSDHSCATSSHVSPSASPPAKEGMACWMYLSSSKTSPECLSLPFCRASSIFSFCCADCSFVTHRPLTHCHPSGFLIPLRSEWPPRPTGGAVPGAELVVRRAEARICVTHRCPRERWHA